MILLLALMALAVASFFVEWGTTTLSKEDVRREIQHQESVKGGLPGMGDLAGALLGGFAEKIRFPVSAGNSAVFLGPLRVPFWTGSAATVFALLILITNSMRFSAVPRGVVFGLSGWGVFIATWAMVGMLVGGSVSAGVGMLLIAAAGGLFTQLQLRRS